MKVSPTVELAMHHARWGLLATALGTAALTFLMAPFQEEIGLLNEGLAFLVLTLVISATWGWRVGVVAAIASSIALNFFFVEPLHTLDIHHPRDLAGILLFLAASLIGGSLLSRARAAAETSRRRQAETEVLLALSRDLIGRADPGDALAALCDNVVRAFDARGASVLNPTDTGLAVLAHAGDEIAGLPPDATDAHLAREALRTSSITARGNAGVGQSRRVRIALPGRGIVDASGGVVFAPLHVGERPLGVLRLHGPLRNSLFREHPEELLAAFAREAALGVQRVELTQEAAHAEALRQTDEMKTALLASVSHDLKTPLAGIKTAVSSLLDRSVAWSDADVQSFLETIDMQADRLNRFISDILDLNRIESGAVHPARRPVQARQLLEEAAERAYDGTRGRPVLIDANGALLVETDESLTVQALVNLVANAAAYSKPGGSIRLSAQANATQADLSVADEGPGIAREDLPHIFERFYRAREQRGRSAGTGLGLSIVQAFVRLAGGSVRVESSEMENRFIVSLPLAPTGDSA
jgi:two-component system sensor histidine kinase KdpD